MISTATNTTRNLVLGIPILLILVPRSLRMKCCRPKHAIGGRHGLIRDFGGLSFGLVGAGRTLALQCSGVNSYFRDDGLPLFPVPKLWDCCANRRKPPAKTRNTGGQL